ncbi:thioredoxin family protein [Joostella atrarenae]|uniref:Thioredoxin family protein n=1 Tax=Joostella atrarenae TaxID=679257 RepID=A0ABS9J5Y5_9FLAO|nr:thioredoxin family protein [Joostella atrarenae]MCF8715836.1 thioredoxin family protein [Joostella atrarenae]
MKKQFLILALAAITFSCGTKTKKAENATPNTTVVQEENTEEDILIGFHTREDLKEEPHNEWFESTYSEYTPDEETVNALKPLVKNQEIKIFMGTWCSDSQREVPHFFKIMDQAGYTYDDFKLITMSREKTTPDNLEKGLNITNVPTIIFYKDGKEINRIVEYTIDSLEKDMLNILEGKDYKNAYAE